MIFKWHLRIHSNAELKELFDFLEEGFKAKMASLEDGLRRLDQETTRVSLAGAERISRMRSVLERAIGPRPGNLYIADSWALLDSYQYLTRTQEEELAFGTGPVVEGTFVIDRILTFPTKRTMVSARADFNEIFGPLMELEKRAHLLLAHFHSHPGKGEGSTFPSSVDLNFQERLERGGYPAIGGIFSRDGFVRFFSKEREFSVIVYGKGVEWKEKDGKLFRLTEIG